MIKANELRIGNWVMFYFGIYERNVQVESIEKRNEIGGYEIELSDGSIKNDFEIKPIPLTPEILEKAGFKKSTEFDIWYYLEKGLTLDIEFDSCFWWSIDDVGDNEGSHKREIKYVHQLQNLFFTLTGNELEIKL